MAQQVGSLSVELSASVAAFQRDLGKAVAAVNSSQARMNRSLAMMEQGFNRVASSFGRMAMRFSLGLIGLTSLASAGSSVVRTMFDLEGASTRLGKTVDRDLTAAIERLKRSTQGATVALATMLGDALTMDAGELEARIAEMEMFQREGLDAPGVPDLPAHIASLKAQLALQNRIKDEMSLDERLAAEQSVRDAIERDTAAIKEREDANDEANAAIQAGLVEEGIVRSEIIEERMAAEKKLQELLGDDAFSRMGDAIIKQKLETEAYKDAVDSLADSWAEGLTKVILKAESAKDVFRALILQMASNAVTTWVSGPIMSAVAGAIFGGARAGGGPVTAGTSYLVGERGPELMTAGSSGHITPLQGSRGGSSRTVIGSINVGQGASVAAVAALQRMLTHVNASIEPRAVAANSAAKRRGGGR